MSIASPTFTARVAAAIKSLDRRRKLWLTVLAVFFLLAIGGFIWQANAGWLVELPTPGGTWREGLIGTPRFVNPLLAASNADRDLTTLIYSGLLRADANGDLQPDLAERYTVSADGKEYRFFLKPNLVWHDGEAVTTADVIFTVKNIQDPSLKSPRRAAWDGVEIIKISDQEIKFTLKQAYAPFLENTTLGLLPAHLWRAVTAENFAFSNLNLEAIGTGPYRIKNIKRDRDNLPLAYELAPFRHFALGEPKLKKLTLNFYPNEEELLTAYQDGAINSLSAVPPASAAGIVNDDSVLITAPLARVFAVFFNQNQNKIFAQGEVREALNDLIDRQALVAQVLNGYGRPVTGPLPPRGGKNLAVMRSPAAAAAAAAEAATKLESAGWQKNSETNLWEQKTKTETIVLAFTLSTSDLPELKTAGGQLKKIWEQFGARVEIKIFEAGALNQNVIRPREYEALLFGEVVSRPADLYSFWHSSQRLDPGLNVALYTNTKVDKLLEKEAYAAAAVEIIRETPAVFLYSPDFLYLLPETIKGVALNLVNTPADRFLNINQWFINTEKIWPIFR